MTGGNKPGDAKADIARDKFKRNDSNLDYAITRLEVRDSIQCSGEPEDSGIIDQRTLEAQRLKESGPPLSGHSRTVVQLIRSVKGWPQATFGLAVLALVAWYMWLHR